MNPSNRTPDLKVLSKTHSNCVSNAYLRCTQTASYKKYGIIASCSHLKRFITAMRYHELLTAAKGREKGDALFTDFCGASYPCFLDDYIHFMRRHSDDLEAIKIDAHEKFGLANCAISHCKVQRRHSRRRGCEKCSESGKDEHFYGDVMASAHFVLQHLHDHGLRTIATAPNTAEHKTTEQKDDDDNELECEDVEFAAKAAQIAQSKKMCGAELGASNKFTIQIGGEGGAAEQNGKGKTDKRTLFMDAFRAFLGAHSDPRSERVLALLSAEHFDSDSVHSDLALDAGNLASDIEALRTDLRGFLRDFGIDARSFSTGFAFQYHAYYSKEENADDFEKEQYINNKHDFGGHSLSALFVRAHFESIKAEVLSSGFVSAAEFGESVVAKAKRYFESADCKAIKCKEGKYRDSLHFGIPYKAKLRVEHLHALFLYTDFSALSTAFSSSFRVVYRGESLKSIKARNGRFHHFAKHLKELVMYFGVCGEGDREMQWKNQSRGPFYCGMSAVLNIPQFAIRLNGPTSTSLHIEVAMRFGGVEGMIIQLNNEEFPAHSERHIDCDWLSAFPEESERLWMGGRFMLNLETVRVIETKNSYRRFLHAFHLFDAMLCGGREGQKVTKTDVRIVRGAVSENLGIKSNGYHSFVNDTFHHFCARKTQIVLNLWRLDERVNNKEFVSLVMNEVKAREYSDVSDDDVNLFKPVLFELFGNVQELVVKAEDGRDQYAFNLESLAQFAFPKSLRRMNIKGKWLEDAFTDSVKQYYQERGWSAECLRSDLKLLR